MTNSPLPDPFLNLSSFSLLVGLLIVLATIFRFKPLFPEPEIPVRTPFGKLPFFDGIILYGLVILILLGFLKILLL
jgi:hypothetical protein